MVAVSLIIGIALMPKGETMAKVITKKQLEELDFERSVDTKEYNRLLEEYTGLVAKPYTGYSYYDSAGDYVGDIFDLMPYDFVRLGYLEVADG